ncbi:ComEA family DNA-binding protein [Streptomyces sp. DH24]|uniref:ComEA family DNA-binding protein n=1 Tax=Streptomyces sp. DH24 TaxID=3040123 RepID=UPI002441C1FC|nr:ComEA family DNA-binding protein [Streptomyces sp. DH24]MDG9719161.1 ComEA family DNA-binding protein [Streptomyces sp. DH24]
MALRSRPRAATATSGPGRGPASDGRTRHRRSHLPRGRLRHRYRHRHEQASAEEVRRRAEVLFGEGVGDAGGRSGVAWASEVSGASSDGAAVPPGSLVPTGSIVPTGSPVPDELARLSERPPECSGAGTGPEGVRGRTGAGERVVDGADDGDEPDAAGLTLRERVGPALRERMPVWLQARCGVERRSVLALTALLVVAAAFAAQHFWAGRTQTVRAPEVVRAAAPYDDREPPAKGGPGTAAPKAPATAGAEIVVDVSGKVREPGIHRLPAGSRVADALRAAGGVRPGTNTDTLNRARFLVDGEQVVVGGPVPAGAGPGGASTTGGGSAGAAGAAGGAGQVPTAPVSLNTATVEQLDTLPGVGPVLAQHIVDYRTQHGGFRSVDELREVTGIGERRFADLRNLVRP